MNVSTHLYFLFKYSILTVKLRQSNKFLITGIYKSKKVKLYQTTFSP